MKPIHTSYSIAAVVAAALSMSVAWAGYSGRPAAAVAVPAAAPIAVSVAPIAMTDVVSTIDAGGVVQARTTATIAARILAPVREVRVSPGERVRAGQTLIVLDNDDLAADARAASAAALAAEQGSRAAGAELLSAEAGLALARASHARIAGLLPKRSATAQELDEATATLRSAEARAAGASARVLQAAALVQGAQASNARARTTEAFTRIAAPFAGMVTEKTVEPGNIASPGMPLLRLEDTREFRLEVRVDESRMGDIRLGDSVPVFLGRQSAAVTGTVVEVGRALDADARAFLVKVALPDVADLRSGEFGRARFRGVARRALTVPPQALVQRGQLTSVFVVDGDVARVRLVSLSESEVLAGLSEAEVVVLSPPPSLTDGRRVSVGGGR